MTRNKFTLQLLFHFSLPQLECWTRPNTAKTCSVLNPSHYGGVIVIPCAVQALAVGIKLVGVPQAKPIDFGMFTKRGSKADYVFGGNQQ